MIRASALHLVIVIALVIALLCSALVAVAYFFRQQALLTERYQILRTNAASGMNILLNTNDSTFAAGKVIDLFGEQTDSVYLKKIPWGAYDVGVSRSTIQKDSVYRIFSIANLLDSTKWSVLYLIDEDRPLSVSGRTAIVGNPFLPKAGVKPAFVENLGYEGNEKMVEGRTQVSSKTLPVMNAQRLSYLNAVFSAMSTKKNVVPQGDSISNSFFLPTRFLNMGKQATLEHISLSGNVIVFADTTLTIGGSVRLNNVLVFARSIVVQKGFEGCAQLFARDSLVIKPHCRLFYPSVVGVLRLKAPKVKSVLRLNVGEGSRVAGTLFTYDQSADRNLQPVIELDKGSTISGYIYSMGILSLKDGVSVQGGVATSRFGYQSNATRYENYLINVRLDETALSRDYLSTGLMPVAGKQQQLLQWLERN